PGGAGGRHPPRTKRSDAARLRQNGKRARPIAHPGTIMSVRRIYAAALTALVISPALAGTACRKRTPAPAAPQPQPVPAPAKVAAETPAPHTGRGAIRHVVIISEDGLRPDALVSVHAPVHEALMKRGSYSLQARTIRRASTLPSHAAMLSGFDIKEHG